MFLDRFRRRQQTLDNAHRLYVETVEQAREPAFFDTLRVADTLDGRFDMVVLHVYLVLRRLERAGEPRAPLSQALFDVMFKDLDRNLREMGVGDLSVGKRIRTMGEAFYGRAKAYAAALDAGDEGGLARALHRNLYRGGAVPDAVLHAMARYVRDADAALNAIPNADLGQTRLDWPAPPCVADAPAQTDAAKAEVNLQ